jgi:hypothetical protein
MFDGGGDYVGRSGQITNRTQKSQVVGFGAAAGEDNLAGGNSERVGESTAGLFEALAGELALAVSAGGIAIDFAQRSQVDL